MSRSFINRIRYKKERIGVVERDGKAYVKYIKSHRFNIGKTMKYAVLSLLILAVLGMGIRMLIYELDSNTPSEVPAVGITG